MNVIDKLYTEWAWRTKTGVPDINNLEDKAILDNIIFETSGNVLSEVAVEYDKYLVDNGFPVIPQAKGKYSQPQGSGDMKVHPDDLATYQKMFPMNAGDQTVGPGEIALYWLFQHQKNPVTCTDNRGGSEPDLTIGSVKAEVKAYKSQFFDPESKEAETPISSKNFIESVNYRAKNFGRLIGTEAGEGFISKSLLSTSNLFDLVR